MKTESWSLRRKRPCEKRRRTCGAALPNLRLDSITLAFLCSLGVVCAIRLTEDAPAPQIPVKGLPVRPPDSDQALLFRKKKAEMDNNLATNQQDFLKWCESALGIETILEMQTFEYPDYAYEFATQNILQDWDEEDESHIDSTGDLPVIQVRGLAASRHISIGETVIRIPLHSLMSVTTTIDQDPVLSPLMGSAARETFGWDLVSPSANGASQGEEEVFFLYELSLLAVALLYHRHLGDESPLSAYISVLEATPVDSMPFLWPRDRFLKSPLIHFDGVRSVAEGIRRDIREMYRAVPVVLMEEHPEVFGKPTDGREWMFSYEHFQWAFAIVNSRHWQLPIHDLDLMVDTDTSGDALAQPNPLQQQALVEDQLPPADMPTDTWVEEHGDTDDDDENTHSTAANEEKQMPGLEHSFLAPVAGLLNFGPPCTRGRYNADTQTFEIVASCPFRKGQEVTFWYSDECDHIMMGMYGFTHPMIPSCPSSEEYRVQSEEWKQRSLELEDELDEAFAEIDEVSEELHRLHVLLKGCSDCCAYEHGPRGSTPSPSGPPRNRRVNNVRGSEVHSDRQMVERYGVRRMRANSRRSGSEF